MFYIDLNIDKSMVVSDISAKHMILSKLTNLIVSDFSLNSSVKFFSFSPEPPFTFFKNGIVYNDYTDQKTKLDYKSIMVLYSWFGGKLIYRFVPFMLYFNTIDQFKNTNQLPVFELPALYLKVFDKFLGYAKSVDKFVIIMCPATKKIFPLPYDDYIRMKEEQPNHLVTLKPMFHDLGMYSTDDTFIREFAKDQLLCIIVKNSQSLKELNPEHQKKALVIPDLQYDSYKDGSMQNLPVEPVNISSPLRSGLETVLVPYFREADMIADLKGYMIDLSSHENRFIMDCALTTTQSRAVFYMGEDGLITYMKALQSHE